MWGWIKRHVGATILIGAVIAYAAYETSTYIFVYTDDAFVATDVVIVAPQVAGQLEALNVRRDQEVKEGEVLFLIDQEPFETNLTRYRALQHQAETDIKAAQDRVNEAKTKIESQTAILNDAHKILERMQDLVERGDVAQQRVDNAQRDHRVAQADLADAQSALVTAEQAVVQAEAALEVARAEVAQSQWAMDRTIVSAASSGRIGPVTAQPGDYINVGQPVLALVTDDDWRIVANVRERFLQGLEPGQTVWFNLGSEPWVWHRGKVRSLAAGVSRSPDQVKVLPYVDPITDWIRLPRRFPVEIDLMGLQHERRLYQGADASVLVFF